MGRKKKSQSPKSPKSSPSVASIGNDPVSPTDVLVLRLVRPAQSKATPRTTSNSQEQDSQLFLTEQDANHLDIVNRDEVLVLSQGEHDGSESVVAAAVCLARINSSSRETPSKRGSSLSLGHCRIAPSVLADRLCVTTRASAQETSLAVTPSSMQSPPTTPSSSKSSFSFAKGGGGDALISPSATPSTPTPSKSFQSKQYLWVIPMHSSLGVKLKSLVCREATCIHLSPQCTTTLPETAWSNSKRILQRLIMATGVGQYHRVGDVLRSSFQGRPVDWEIHSIEGMKLDDSNIMNEDFADMSLKDDPEDAERRNVLEAFHRGASQHVNKHSICLYRMTYDTEILLTPDKNDIVEKDKISVNGKADQAPREVVVAGLDATLEHVKSILLPPLLHPEIFAKGHLRPPRGVLLHGPSGVGKSMLARQVAIDLQRSHVRVETINCTSLQSHTAIVGEAERRLTRMIRSAEKSRDRDANGTLIVLDDIHLICPKRGGAGGSSAGSDRLAATLLALLDGIGGSSTGTDGSKRHNVVFLAVTANPSLLDPALRRPGRLDAEVEVPIPDELTRAAILKFQLNQVSEDIHEPSWSDADISALSRMAKGFNGADCMLAIKEALRKAIVRSSEAYMSPTEDGSSNSYQVQLTIQDLQSAIRATKPSTIKSITVEIPQVHWASIGGMDFVKQMLREAIELPLTHAHLFEALHIPPPRGVLLYGPPGCSKTLMARALATEGHMNFLAVKGPELLSKWLGESERALASLFRRARMASPCIIFFDEIDAIAIQRGSGGNSGGERLLSQLLTELDGINNPGGSVPNKDGSTRSKRVIVVGATNRPDLLDSALMRPGRIDRMIYVGLPDRESRARILEIGLKGKACGDDIDIPSLASDNVTGGYSGAEVIAICREAALFAIEEDDENMSQVSGSLKICMKHLLRAVQGMKRQITPEMLKFYASFQHNPSS